VEIYENEMDVEEQIFFSHPELLVLQVLLYGKLEGY
jgi:hypothetical protein